MNRKLTLISITFRGVRHSKFIMLPYDERGKAIVDESLYQQMATDAGCERGSTFTLT